MSKFTRAIALLAFVFVLVAVAPAQTFTTLSQATTASANVVYVASATGITAPGTGPLSNSGIGQPSTASGQTVLFIDGEVMDVTSVSGTTIGVRRGTNGTAAKAHVSAAKVGILAVASYRQIAAARANFVNQGIGAALASATTIAPTNYITHVTGTTNVVNITVPSAFALMGGELVLIPDGLWSTTNAGNIAIATTGVVSKALTMRYDPIAAKWYPSY